MLSEHYQSRCFQKKTKVKQWRNTSMIIDWFKNIADTQKRKFIKFDTAKFYPSISEDLLNRLIMWNHLQQSKKMSLVQWNLHANHCSLVKMTHELRKVVRWRQKYTFCNWYSVTIKVCWFSLVYSLSWCNQTPQILP